MTSFPVSLGKSKALEARMEQLGIKSADLDEHFIRSGGSGGQNVNKVATCVVLKHHPSGIEIKCQEARTQGLNRYHARCRLCDKLEAQMLGKKSAEKQKQEKIRRQKRRRSRRAKQKMLENKRKQGEKKQLRQAPKI